ncbi:helix-turn-helix domain-containing protein [Embleya sp. NPDC056575]|uniref:helix-turn-helix domain-containing protein n=1 Tax=unclassified Embleya TaxID=2699296 RepID=UPI003680FEB4
MSATSQGERYAVSGLGDNVRRYRRVAGLSQEQLAEAAGLGVSTVAKVEQGGDVRIATLHVLARALDLPTSALFAPSVPKPVRDEVGSRIQLIALRQALTPPVGLIDRADSAELTPRRLAATRARIDRAHELYQADRYESMADELPAILRAVPSAEGPEGVGEVRVAALHAAGKYLTQVRQYDLAYHAFSESIRDARAMGRAHLAATGVGGLCWLLLRQGRFDECEHLAAETADGIEPRLSRATAGEIAVWGELLQRVAAAAVRNNNPDVAREARRMAGTAATAVGVEHTDRSVHWGSFGPVTAHLKTLEDFAVVGDHRGLLRGVEHTPKPITGPPPSPNTQNRHRLDIALAQAHVGEFGEAMTEMRTVLQAAPEWVRHQSLARDVVRLILKKRKRTLTTDMRELADHLRVTG